MVWFSNKDNITSAITKDANVFKSDHDRGTAQLILTMCN